MSSRQSRNNSSQRDSNESSKRRYSLSALDIRLLSAWDSMKKSLKQRPSFFRFQLKSNATSQAEPAPRLARDVEDGLFCDVLVGLMQRSEKHDCLDSDKKPKNAQRVREI